MLPNQRTHPHHSPMARARASAHHQVCWLHSLRGRERPLLVDGMDGTRTGCSVWQELAVQNEVGLVENPLKISWLEGQPHGIMGPSHPGLSKVRPQFPPAPPGPAQGPLPVCSPLSLLVGRSRVRLQAHQSKQEGCNSLVTFVPLEGQRDPILCILGFLFVCFLELGIEPRASHRLTAHCTTVHALSPSQYP